jgi:hypothetical protein
MARLFVERSALAALLACATIVAGCGAGGSATWPATPASTAAGDGAGATSAVMSADDALLTYGYGPTPNPAVTFQPDVVVVGGGAASIRWASADGHTWAVDPAASGAANLRVGSVMFLTSRAVGRVASIQDAGGSRVVTLVPVQLTEIFSDANFNLDQPVDLASMAYQALPPSSSDATDVPADQSPGVDGSASPGALTAPAIRFVAARAAGGPANAAYADTTATQLPPAAKSCPEVTLADKWSLKPCLESNKISLGIDYKTDGGFAAAPLKFGGVVSLRVKDMHTLANFQIKAGNITNSTVLLEGIQGIDVSVAAGVSAGVKSDTKLKFELPVEVELPIPPASTDGIPLNLVLEFKAIVEVAMSGNNSTMQASASYALTGPLGIRDGSLVTPSFSVNNSILDSLSGITLGPSGVVLAAKFKMHFGLGMDGWVAGPYATTTFSVGISKGSIMGSPLEDCRGATIGLWVGAGLGATVDLTKWPIPFLPSSVTKFKTETEVNANVYTVTKTVPDSKACQL